MCCVPFPPIGTGLYAGLLQTTATVCFDRCDWLRGEQHHDLQYGKSNGSNCSYGRNPAQQLSRGLHPHQLPGFQFRSGQDYPATAKSHAAVEQRGQVRWTAIRRRRPSGSGTPNATPNIRPLSVVTQMVATESAPHRPLATRRHGQQVLPAPAPQLLLVTTRLGRQHSSSSPPHRRGGQERGHRFCAVVVVVAVQLVVFAVIAAAVVAAVVATAQATAAAQTAAAGRGPRPILPAAL